jgi:hypothetical protein
MKEQACEIHDVHFKIGIVLLDFYEIGHRQWGNIDRQKISTARKYFFMYFFIMNNFLGQNYNA